MVVSLFCRENDYDLVLMDLEMPGMGGLEATRAILAMEGREHPPIVALTAHATGGERDRCREAGMVDFLTKPFEASQLLRVVDRWSRGRV